MSIQSLTLGIVYLELDLVFKLAQRFLNLKRCAKLKLKSLKIGKTKLKPSPNESLNKFHDVKIGIKGSFEKEKPHNSSHYFNYF